MSFSMTHTVTLNHPLSTVFPVLSEPKGIERLQRLTPEAQHFSFRPSDNVRLPKGGLAPLITFDHPRNPKALPRPREMEAVAPQIEDADKSDGEGKIVERAWFEFGGTVPILFKLINSPLSVAGAQIVDIDAKIVVFESGVAAHGIKEVKVRTFKEVDLPGGGKGTVVKETVWGTCPRLLSYLLKIIAPRVHKHHMDIYYKLFE